MADQLDELEKEVDKKKKPEDDAPSEDTTQEPSAPSSEEESMSIPEVDPSEEDKQMIADIDAGKDQEEQVPASEPVQVPAPVPMNPQQDLMARYQAAIKQRDDQQKMAMILAGSQQIANAGVQRAIPGHQADMTGANMLMKTAGQPVEDVEASQKLENMSEKFKRDIISGKLKIQNQQSIQDPDSPESQAAKEFFKAEMKAQGKEINDEQLKGMSAAGLYRLAPAMQKLVYGALQAKRADQADRRLVQGDRKLDISQTNQYLRSNKQNQDFANTLDKSIDPTTNPGMRPINSKLMAMQRVENMAYDKYGTLRDLPPELMSTFVLDYAGAIGPGSGTVIAQGLVNKLDPQSAARLKAGWQQWLTNQPTGSGQQEFMKLYLDQMENEKKLASAQIQDWQLKGLARNKQLYNSDPALFYTTTSNRGINQDQVNEYMSTLNTDKSKASSIQAKSGLKSGKVSDIPDNSTSQTVQMLLPDGRQVPIKKEMVEEAKRRGAKEI